MSINSNDKDSGSALRSATALLEQELERLKAELEVIQAGNHPQRRTMIIDHVNRIDERQDALDKLRVSETQSGPR